MYGNKTLIETPLFALLEKAVHEPHSATDGFSAAYDGFVTTLESLCESGVSHSHLQRTLCYTRQELLALRDDIAAGETRKEISSVCTKALGMIRCEEEILRHCIEHPQPLSVRLTWQDSKTGLCENIFAWHAKGSFGNIPLTRLAGYIQQVFNIDLSSNLSRTFGEMRLRNDPTPYLDSMTAALLKRMKRTRGKR